MKEMLIVVDGQPFTVKIEHGSVVVVQLWAAGEVAHSITVQEKQ